MNCIYTYIYNMHSAVHQCLSGSLSLFPLFQTFAADLLEATDMVLSAAGGRHRAVVPYPHYELHDMRGVSMVRHRSRYNENLYQYNKKGCNDNTKKIKATW